MFRKLSFRWLNIQIAPLPMAPRSSPSSQLWQSMLGMRSCCTHPASGERPHSPLLNPNALSGRPAFDVLVIWRTQGYQLAVNSVTTLHRSQGQAAEPTEPAWPSRARQLCCWWTWLIPRNAGLSSCSSVNDFIQRGEVTRGLVIKGLHFTVKTACMCAALQKSPLRKKRVKMEENIQVSLAPERQSLSKRWAKPTSCHSCLLFSFLSPIVGEIIIGRPMNY